MLRGGLCRAYVGCIASITPSLVVLWVQPAVHACVVCSVSDDLLKSYLVSYTDTPWEALKYLIAEVNYGGRVTDELDRRLLGSYLSRCVMHTYVC